MKYNDALKFWGKSRIEAVYPKSVIGVYTVDVQMNFDEGWPCCGGRDPECYCSMAESPTANVTIKGQDAYGTIKVVTIDQDSFDFADILSEIVDAAGGTLTKE